MREAQKFDFYQDETTYSSIGNTGTTAPTASQPNTSTPHNYSSTFPATSTPVNTQTFPTTSTSTTSPSSTEQWINTFKEQDSKHNSNQYLANQYSTNYLDFSANTNQRNIVSHQSSSQNSNRVTDIQQPDVGNVSPSAVTSQMPATQARLHNIPSYYANQVEPHYIAAVSNTNQVEPHSSTVDDSCLIDDITYEKIQSCVESLTGQQPLTDVYRQESWELNTSLQSTCMYEDDGLTEAINEDQDETGFTISNSHGDARISKSYFVDLFYFLVVYI